MLKINLENIDRKHPLATNVFCYENKTDPTGTKSAIKLISKDTKTLISALWEIAIGFSCSHPNVLPIQGFDISPPLKGQNWVIKIKMPLMKQSLADLLQEKIDDNKSFTQEEITEIFYDVIQGITYLHKQKIVHRDIKLGNVLVSNKGVMQIADFGIASYLRDDSTTIVKEFAGTLQYLAPETTDYSKLENKELYKTDLWSLGIMMLKLCLGSEHKSVDKKLIELGKGKEKEHFLNETIQTLRNRYDNVLLDLIQRLLRHDPNKRINLEELNQALESTYSKIVKGRKVASPCVHHAQVRVSPEEKKIKRLEIEERKEIKELQISNPQNQKLQKINSKDGSTSSKCDIITTIAHSNDMLIKIFQEIVLAFNCNHPNVLAISDFEIIQGPEKAWTIKIQIPRTKQSLQSLLKDMNYKKQAMTTEKIIEIFYDLTQAIKYLHSKKKAHQKIDLVNVLLNNENRIMLDMGVRFLTMPVKDHTVTLSYSAPESVDGSKLIDEELYKLDLRNLGELMLNLFSGSEQGSLDKMESEKTKEKDSFVRKEISALQNKLDGKLLELIQELLGDSELRINSQDLTERLESLYPQILKERIAKPCMQCESDLEKDVDARKSQENQEYKANLMKKQPTNQEASKTKQQGIDSTRIDWQDPLVEDKDTVVYRYKSKQNPNEKEWAIKIVSTGCNKNLVKIVKEIVIGFGCNHPNILPIKRYHLNYDETHSKWEVQMKIPRVKQSLKDLLNEKINKKEPFTNQEIIEILYDIAQGLEYLHDRKIVHQDLKLANVLVSNANIMRLDIGIGAGIGDDSTNAYLAPEWREDQIAEKKGLYKMDMWSLGIIVLKLCLGSNGSSLDRIPYKKPENKEDFVMKIQTLPSQFDKHVRDLIENLLDKNPEKRMSSGGLKQKLEEMYPNIKVKRASVITSVSRESKGFNLEEKKKEILHNDKAKQNSIEKTNEEQFGNISKGNFKSQIKCAQNQNIQSINQQKHQELKEENEKLVESQKPPPGVKPVESIERTRVKEEEINKNENWKEDAL